MSERRTRYIPLSERVPTKKLSELRRGRQQKQSRERRVNSSSSRRTRQRQQKMSSRHRRRRDKERGNSRVNSSRRRRSRDRRRSSHSRRHSRRRRSGRRHAYNVTGQHGGATDIFELRHSRHASNYSGDDIDDYEQNDDIALHGRGCVCAFHATTGGENQGLNMQQVRLMPRVPNTINTSAKLVQLSLQKRGQNPGAVPIMTVAPDTESKAETKNVGLANTVKHVALNSLRTIFGDIFEKEYNNNRINAEQQMDLARAADAQINAIEHRLNEIIDGVNPVKTNERETSLLSDIENKQDTIKALAETMNRIPDLVVNGDSVEDARAKIKRQIELTRRQLQQSQVDLNKVRQEIELTGEDFVAPMTYAQSLTEIENQASELIDDFINKLSDADPVTKANYIKLFRQTSRQHVIEELRRLIRQAINNNNSSKY
jgi:hypothetical protein